MLIYVSMCVCVQSHFYCVRLFVTLWTIVCQAPLSMGFSRQEYWSELPCPPLGDLPNPGTELVSLISPALAGGQFTTSATWEDPYMSIQKQNILWVIASNEIEIRPY